MILTVQRAQRESRNEKKKSSYAKPAVSIPRFDDDSDNYYRRRESSRTNGPARGIVRSLPTRDPSARVDSVTT